MKNTKGYLAALAVAVLFGALQFAGSNVPSKSLQTATVPTGYTDAEWVMVSLPSNTTTSSAVVTINHADTGDVLSGSYNVNDTTGGALTNDDCGGLVLYYGKSYKSDPTTMRSVTAQAASSVGTGCVFNAVLTDNSGNPIKLALGDTGGTVTGYLGTLYTQQPKNSNKVTQVTGQAPTVEFVVTSSYGSCDYGKYWDTATSTCITQPSCGGGTWDSTTNACSYGSCTTDTWGLNKPECSPTSTNYSDCRDPYYWYNKTSGVFEKCSKDAAVKADFCNNTTEHTQCETVKTDRVRLLETAWGIDPASKTEWLANSWSSYWWEPPWDSTAPYKKYDPATDALIACTSNSTTWVSGQYSGSCQPVPVKWEPWYLDKWRMDYAEWKKWNSTPTPTPTPTPTTCDYDAVCEPNESSSSCSDCGGTPTPTTCDYDAVCESNESSSSCTDCGTGPMPVPTPAPWPSPTPSKCSTTDTNCIDSGSTGPASGWCYNGMSCYNNDKTQKYCKPWSYTGGSSTTCSGDYPNLCGPNDTNCIEPGQYGDDNGWCTSAMECFIDGKKFCQPYSNDPYKMTSCPAGSKQCSTNDTNCIEPGTSSTNLDGWCKNAQECFNTAGTEKYCLAWDINPNGYEACPTTHPKACRPGDTNCVEIGETGSSTAWCASGGKQCYVDAGIKCVSWEASCPSGSKACRPGDVGCVEPGTKVTYKANDWSKWCGGSSVSCYSGTEMECVAISGSDPRAWENASCSTGFGRCRPDDNYCLELGETGPSGSWCASGMSKWNTDGTVTCVSMKDGGVTPPPEPEICLTVLTPGYDAATGKCKIFSDSCIPEGWSNVPEGKICVDGFLKDLEDQTDIKVFINIYREHFTYLKDLKHQLIWLSDNPDAFKVEALRSEALTELLKLEKFLTSNKKSDLELLKVGLDDFKKNYRVKLDDLLSESVQVFIDYATLKREVRPKLESWKIELSRIETGTDYYIELSDGVAKLEAVMLNADSQKDAKVLSQLVSAVRIVSDDIEGLVVANYAGKKSGFIMASIDSFVGTLSEMHEFVAANDDVIPTGKGIRTAITRFSEKVKELQDIYAAGDEKKALSFIDDLNTARDQLARWLAPYGFDYDIDLEIDWNDIFSHVDQLLNEKIDALMNELTNKVAIMVDEVVQNIMVQVAEVIDHFSKEFEKQIAKVIENLIYIPNPDVADEITDAKNKIVEKVNLIAKELDMSDLSAFIKEALYESLEYASYQTFCGDYAESVAAALNSVGLAVENGTFDDDDLQKFRDELPTEEEIHRICYENEAESFEDVWMTTWFYGSAEFNKQCHLVEGYRDASGKLTGEFGPADATTREQALKMFMELLGIPQGDTAALVKAVPGVSDWAIGYINGALNAGIEFDWNLPMHEPIKRYEAIGLLTDMLIDQGYIQMPLIVDNVDEYGDYAQFDGEFALEAQAMYDAGVFMGSSDGNLYPDSQLLRSEFSTVNKRVIENLGIEIECS